MADHAQLTSSLPDLLDQLPVDVVGRNLWQQLTQKTRGSTGSQGSLRQCSKQCLRLANILTTHVALQEDSDEADPDQSGQPEAWHQAVEQRSAFLARLPRLDSLHLIHWPGEAALTALLTRYGAATGGRLARLTLQGARVSIHTTSTLRAACPRLTDLGLNFEDRQDNGEAWAGGDLLLPLKDLPLTSLNVNSDTNISADLLRSLPGLSRLQRLDLRLMSRDFQPFTALFNLQHLCIGREFWEDDPITLLDVTALFTLTRLTHLEMRSIRHKPPPPPVAADAGAADLAAAAAAVAAARSAATAMQAAVAPLANLQQLRTLSLASDFVMDDPVFLAVRHLSLLTRLDVGRIQLARPLRGALPGLQHLQVRSMLRPLKLLQTLQPLLPLPSLRRLGASTPWDLEQPMQLMLSAFCRNPVEAAEQAAALRAAAGHLAAAPQLAPALSKVSVLCKRQGWEVLPPLDLAAGLQPLGGRLEQLDLVGMSPMGPEWAALGAYLPRLHSLSIISCAVTDAALVAVGCGASLARLQVEDCRGVTVEGWLGLAAVRGSALRLRVYPALSPEDVLRCQRVQAHLFGVQHLTFE